MAKTYTTTWMSIFLLVVIAATASRYYDYIQKKNFLLEVNTVCDPATETCFVADCTAGEPDCDTTPYKKVEIAAKDAPACLEEHTCEAFSCENIEGCTITYCSEGSLEDGEKCVDIAQTASSSDNNQDTDGN